MGKTFVGIGFGPIQSGLFLLEAQLSGNFEQLVVAEVVPEVVAAVRSGGGRFRVNVADEQGIATQEISGVEIYNPSEREDADRLIDAVAAADEIATALPSVEFYQRGKPSPVEVLARGLEQKLTKSSLPPAVVYAAENHNHAAELLREGVAAAIDSQWRTQLDERTQFVNTMIGKMSGVVTDARQIERDRLATLVEGGTSAVLVEKFNRILISQVRLPGFQRGIEVFQEKADLLPFEEAKLFGHNAAHALLGYLGQRQGLEFIHQAASSELLLFVERAFLDESGEALCRRHTGVDSLFTQDGWAGYAQDLLVRMVNPHLQDRVDRVTRDPRRKLGWNDRLVGTMRLAIENGIAPRRYAVGAAAAARMLLAESSAPDLTTMLDGIWQGAVSSAAERDEVIAHIAHADADLSYQFRRR